MTFQKKFIEKPVAILATVLIALLPLISALGSESIESTVEGIIAEISLLPKTDAAEYPNCNYSALLKINGIVDGVSLPREVVIVIPGFAEYQKLPLADLQKNEKRRFRLIPFDQMPESIRSIQIANDLNIFNLEYYFVLESEKLAEFSTQYGNISFVEPDKYLSPFENPVNPPLSQQILADKEYWIKTELEYVNARLNELPKEIDSLNAKFSAATTALQKKSILLPGNLIWGKSDKSYFSYHIGMKLVGQRELAPDIIEAVKSLDDFFAANGIRFIIQMIPNYQVIAARIAHPEFTSVVDVASAVAVKQLLEAGVETVFSSDEIIANFNKYELMFLYPYDFHPAHGCQDVLTTQILPRLEVFKDILPRELDPDKFSVKPVEGLYWEINSDSLIRWGAMLPLEKELRQIPGVQIFYDNQRITRNSKSKIMVIGNSFIASPAPDSSYSAFLSKKLGTFPAVIRSSGAGVFTTLSMGLFNRPERYLKDKCVVILPICTDYFYGFGDSNFLNLRKLDNGKKSISGKSKVAQIALEKNLPDDDSIQSISEAQNKNHLQDWEKATSKGQYAIIGITDPKQKITLPTIDLTDKINPKLESTVAIKVASLRYKKNSIELNGVEQKVATYRRSEWDTLFFYLPPGEKTLNITFSTESKNSLLMLDDIAIYQ